MHWLDRVINERGYIVGAEVGVSRGYTTKHLLYYNPELLLYAVDLWDLASDATAYTNYDFDEVKRHFEEATLPFQNRLMVFQGLSWEMSDQIEDEFLDFVFIDADHGYPSVSKDIRAWTPKLRSDGMISGHDINLEGVLKAVKELVPNYKRSPFGLCWEAKKEDVQL